MDTYIKPIKDDERLAHGIALTRALKENIFAVIVGIECNIPATRLELFRRRRGVHTICVFFSFWPWTRALRDSFAYAKMYTH